MLLRLADNTDADSLASSYRNERVSLFLRLFGSKRPLRILDIGGTVAFWDIHHKKLPHGTAITLVNLDCPEQQKHRYIRQIRADGRDLHQFSDREFDVCFSNSTIEHVGTAIEQAAMAREIRRVGQGYFVQTPNRYFPIEPHFLVPFWQFLPLSLRVWCHRKSTLGWMKQESDPVKAHYEVASIQLLTLHQLQQLFPDATVHRETVGPLTKSFVAYRTVETC